MRYVYDFDHEHAEPPKELKALLGGKGANLAEMTSVLGLPVPHGFTISTDACRDYMGGGWPSGLDGEIAEHLAKLEGQMARRLGDADDPLLVSVRSGAKFSMPGMMDTVLNLGLNDELGRGSRQADERRALRLRLLPPLRPDVRPHRARRPGRGASTTPLEALKERTGALPTPSSRAEALRSLSEELQGRRRRAHRRPVPPGPDRSAARRDRGGLRVLERRPRDGVPHPRAHPARPRHRGQRPGDGLRESRRPVRHRRRVHPRPGHGRARAPTATSS